VQVSYFNFGSFSSFFINSMPISAGGGYLSSDIMERAIILSGEYGYLFTLLLNKISLNAQQFDLVKVALGH